MAKISNKILEDKFSWKSGDLTFSDEISLPDNLKKVVSEAPETDQAIAKYLKRLLNSGIITTDEATFLIDSGALQN
ncbi:MAG: hypothetical protein ACYSYU_10735 [Planctomycetota bacterium]|jgi:hypothetical protein